MLTDTRRERPPLPPPLTHRACFAAGQALAAQGAPDPRPWVQVRRFAKGGSYVLCGQIIELGGRDADWFKVDTTMDGPVWADSANVRMCSGDGRCTCEPAKVQSFALPRPLRSTGSDTEQETQQPCDFQRGFDVQPTGHLTR